jgi:DNA-binding CsgD family transcriptional regulator
VTRKDAELPRTLNASPRLIDVLALLLLGWSNKLIARELALSVETVKQYVTILLSKLGVASRAQVPMAVNQHHQALLAWDRDRRERQAIAMSRATATSEPATDDSSPSLPDRRPT